jgi:hypothetical protein
VSHFLFEGHRLDLGRRELRRGSEQVMLEPQVFDLIAYLVKNRDRVLSKGDLIAAIWEGRAISDSTLTSRSDPELSPKTLLLRFLNTARSLLSLATLRLRSRDAAAMPA